jgi:hypothetical protein
VIATFIGGALFYLGLVNLVTGPSHGEDAKGRAGAVVLTIRLALLV